MLVFLICLVVSQDDNDDNDDEKVQLELVEDCYEV